MKETLDQGTKIDQEVLDGLLPPGGDPIIPGEALVDVADQEQPEAVPGDEEAIKHQSFIDTRTKKEKKVLGELTVLVGRLFEWQLRTSVVRIEDIKKALEDGFDHTIAVNRAWIAIEDATTDRHSGNVEVTKILENMVPVLAQAQKNLVDKVRAAEVLYEERLILMGKLSALSTGVEVTPDG